VTLPSASDACRAAEQPAIVISRIRRRGRRFNSDTHPASPRTRPGQVCTYRHTKSIILEIPNPDCVPTTPHHLRLVRFPNRIRILFAMEHRLQHIYIFFTSTGGVRAGFFGSLRFQLPHIAFASAGLSACFLAYARSRPFSLFFLLSSLHSSSMVGWLLGYLVDPASHSSGKRLFSGFHFGFSRADGMAGGGSWFLVLGTHKLG
jgi:hypothetical protein